MFNTKYKAAQKQIEALEKRIEELERNSRYFDDKVLCGAKDPMLSAEGILARLDEIYEVIGVERKTTPATPSETKLVKIKKK